MYGAAGHKLVFFDHEKQALHPILMRTTDKDLPWYKHSLIITDADDKSTKWLMWMEIKLTKGFLHSNVFTCILYGI